MKFSILIAQYNNGRFFKDCYDSIIHQTYKNWEVILVDDCSTDDSVQIIKDIIGEDKRFRIFENQENQGCGFTKRKCAELASGEILAFVDPDDAILPNALELTAKSFQSENDIAVHSKIYHCDGQLKVKSIFGNSRKIKANHTHFFNVFFNVTAFFAFRKSAYEKTIGINAELQSAVDQDLYLKLSEIGSFTFLNKPLYLYRLHGKGISQDLSKKKKLYKNWHKVLENTLKRRKISILYNKEVNDIECLPNFIFENKNTLMTRINRKINRLLNF